MEEGRLAYRVRTAEVDDAAALREAIGSTLAHPDHQGRRESYRGAAARGDILVLERYDRPAHDWQLAGFVECHMRCWAPATKIVVIHAWQIVMYERISVQSLDRSRNTQRVRPFDAK